jgi:hypothetical protein
MSAVCSAALRGARRLRGPNQQDSIGEADVLTQINSAEEKVGYFYRLLGYR